MESMTYLYLCTKASTSPELECSEAAPVGNAGVDVVADFFELHRYIDLFDKFDPRRIA